MNATTVERLKILQMLEEGKVTADEAAALLRAVTGGRRADSSAGGDTRCLRIQVTDLASGANKVHVTLPIGLANVGLRLAERFAPEDSEIDFQNLSEFIASGATGQVVQVLDAKDNERVEIYIE